MADNVMANNGTSHHFHAEAHALSGKLILPFEEQIKKQALVKLDGDSKQLLLEGKGDQTGQGEETRKLREKRAQENYLSQHSKNYRLESIISYSAAHTQVSGHRSEKHPGAFVTLSTSVVENLNVLNVVTADRVVGQISTTHFPDQHSPHVTLLGTHFENLRIARHRCIPALNLGLVGARPIRAENEEGDKYYLPHGTDLMTSLKNQFDKWENGFKGFLAKIEEKHAQRLRADDSWPPEQYYESSKLNIGKLQADVAVAVARDDKAGVPITDGTAWKGLTCSLVEHIDIEDIVIPVKMDDPKEGEKPEEGEEPRRPRPKPIVYHPPAHCLGHVIHVPDFGTIFLAELRVNHNSFRLTMIRLELGCIAHGSASFATCAVNGGGKGGGGGGT